MGIIYSEKGEILRSFVGKNQNATDDRWLFQSQLSEVDNIQDAEKFQHAGFASRAPDGSKIIIERVSDTYLVSVAEYDGIIASGLGSGDTKVYSTNQGAIAAVIDLLNTGKISIGNGTDELLSLFDELLTELQKTVDLTGASSTGTLFKINPAIANIQSRLGNIKV